jgi:hypothetical protein
MKTIKYFWIKPNDGRDYQLSLDGQWYAVSSPIDFNDEELNFGEKGQMGIFEDHPEEGVDYE